MPKQEFELRAGNARFKFMELVTTSNGVYLIFPIPEMKMHLSFHYPNELHDTFGAFLRVPGIKRSYTLDLDEDILTVNNLLRRLDSFNSVIESGYGRSLDDSDVMVLPDSLFNSFSESNRRNYTDMSNFMIWDWRFAKADQLPELVSRTSPTIAGVSLDRENTAILFDRDEGAFQLSLDEFTQAFNLDLFGSSFQRSLEDALDEIEARRPDVIERATPTEFINEIQKNVCECWHCKINKLISARAYLYSFLKFVWV